MKKYLSVILVLAMLFGLAGCGAKNGGENGGTPAAENTSAKEKEEKTAYYKTWAQSADIGFAGESSRMDLDLGGVRFMLDAGKNHIGVAVGAYEVVLYETEDKCYLHTVDTESGEDEWMVSPRGEESAIESTGDMNTTMDPEGFGEVEYTGTITEDGVKYDVVNVTTKEDLFEQEETETDHVYKMYVTADTHKIAKIFLEQEVETDETDEKGEPVKVKVTGTVSFGEGIADIKAPADATETTNDELMMNFAFTFLGILMSSAEASAVFPD